MCGISEESLVPSPADFDDAESYCQYQWLDRSLIRRPQLDRAQYNPTNFVSGSYTAVPYNK